MSISCLSDRQRIRALDILLDEAEICNLSNQWPSRTLQEAVMEFAAAEEIFVTVPMSAQKAVETVLDTQERVVTRLQVAFFGRELAEAMAEAERE